MQPVVHRQNSRAEPAVEGDPADAARRDQPQALILVKVLKHRSDAVNCSVISESSPGTRTCDRDYWSSLWGRRPGDPGPAALQPDRPAEQAGN